MAEPRLIGGVPKTVIMYGLLPIKPLEVVVAVIIVQETSLKLLLIFTNWRRAAMILMPG
jgi:hypothetical protein